MLKLYTRAACSTRPSLLRKLTSGLCSTHFGVHLRVPASVAQGLAALAPGERYLTAKIQLQANDDGHFLATAQSLEFSESPPQVCHAASHQAQH